MLNPKSAQMRSTLLIGLSLALLFIGSLTVWPVSPVQAGPTLPARSTPSSKQPANDDHGDKDKNKPVGAYIELQPQNPPAGAWSVVQWQDTNGDWHDVDGWAGSLDSQGQRRWWVAAKDFGSGPFRWLIRQGSSGSILLTSDTFTLPTEANQIVVVYQ